ncbi:MAG TPA: class I SAM-dependent methyltransferase [Jatrophihabitantaceae bacterium]|nr:class I SAM-dependent methyltransferase [Jatrophihabitantaceae bacterium]
MTSASTPEPARSAAAPGSDWATAWDHAENVGGWMTVEQGRGLWAAAAAVATGERILEIGSHQGRSTVVLATAARGRAARVTAIDPFIEGRLFGGMATRDRFEQNLAQAGVRDVVDLIVEKSTVLRPTWTEPLAMLYIDGKHDYWTVRDDLRWTEHVTDGAPVLVHDSFSSIGVTLGLLLHALPNPRLRYLGRTGSMARFEVGAPSRRDRMRMLAELPWFARNVAIKIGLRVLRVVGYRGTPDPY